MSPVGYLLGLGMLLLVAFVVLGLPLLSLGFFFRSGRKPISGKVRITRWVSGGVFLAWLALVVGAVVYVGPWRTGILCHGVSPDGREYCVVQTRDFVDFRVTFYLRNAEGAWQWHYLAHDDDAWRSASVEFTPATIRINRDGTFEREFPRQRDPSLDKYNLPATATVEDVFAAQNR